MNRDVFTWLLFLGVISAVLVSINLYIGYKLSGAFPQSSHIRLGIWISLAVMALVVFAGPLLRVFGSSLHSSVKSFIVLTGYTYLGAIVTLSFAFLFLDLFQFLVPNERREFLSKAAPWLALSVSGLAVFKGFLQAQGGPKIVPVDLNQKDLHPDLKGLKMVQISDLHVSSTIKRSYVEDVVKRTNDLKPDLIFLTGDFVDGTYTELKEDVDPLRNLRATYGVFYVTGNHEYYWGHEDWEKVFKEFGFKILHNSSELIQHKGARIAVAGVPDFTFERQGLGEVNAGAAFNNTQDSDFVVFMVHQPSGYKLVQNHKCHLMLSGHTHSGQFFPVSLFIGLFHKYARGLYRHEDRFWVYVNPGTGYWGPVNRLGVPSEITAFSLTEQKT